MDATSPLAPARVRGVPAEYAWIAHRHGPHGQGWRFVQQAVYFTGSPSARTLLDEITIRLADGRELHYYFLPYAPIQPAGDASACIAQHAGNRCMQRYCEFMETPAFLDAVATYGASLPPEFTAAGWIAANCPAEPTAPAPAEPPPPVITPHGQFPFPPAPPAPPAPSRTTVVLGASAAAITGALVAGWLL